MKLSLLVTGVATFMVASGPVFANAVEVRPSLPQSSQPLLAGAEAGSSAITATLKGAAAEAKATRQPDATSHDGTTRDFVSQRADTAATGTDSPAPIVHRHARHDALPAVLGLGDGVVEPQQPAEPSSSSRHTGLGWQSLLPGSIQ